MIKTWNEFCTQIEASDGKLSEFIETAGLSALQIKKLQKFTCEWNKLKKLAEAFDQFISPVDPIAIESPFDQDDFRYIWKTWKEYLREQHGMLMRTRWEQMSLLKLDELSEHNVDKAIYFLRNAMAGGYKGFFIPSDKDKTTPPKTDKDGSTW